MFNGNLYETQKQAAEFLCNKRRALLAWEQGTGKTIIALASAEVLFGLGRARTCLILAPTSIAWQWQEKIVDFTDSVSDLVVAGVPNERKESYVNRASSCKYLIVPYSLFRTDYDALIDCKFDIVIADEAQEFKNNQSKTAKLLKQFNRDTESTYRWALTGTAISNKLEELYSIFFWIDKGFLPPWPEFEKNHIIRNDYTNAITKYKNLSSLNSYLQERMDRKTHKDMEGQLPELVHKFYKLEPSKEYKAAEQSLTDSLDQMAADLLLNENGELSSRSSAGTRKAFATARKELSSEAKYSRCIQLLDELRDEQPECKVVVFSTYKQPLYSLREHYRTQDSYERTRSSSIEPVLFTGDQTAKEKQEAIQAFKDRSFLLLSSNAGYAGLDLGFASHVIHIDIPFSFSVLDQRNKRITRLTSNYKTAVAHYLLMGIELFYYQQVLRKGRLAEAVQEGTENEVVMKSQSLRQFLINDRSSI